MDRVKAGGCTVHARRCGGDNGIFLRLRKCQVILLSDVKRGMNNFKYKYKTCIIHGYIIKIELFLFILGILLPAPYVDEYGECDEGLKRGIPLKLNKAMYEDLKKVYA